MMALNITMIVVWIAYVIASLIAGNTKAIGYAIIGMVFPCYRNCTDRSVKDT